MNAAARKSAVGAPRSGSIRSWAVRSGTVATQALWLALLVAVPCRGQSASSGGQSTNRRMQTPQVNIDGSMAGDVGDPGFEARRLRQFGVAQHKAIVEDTGKLLKLVTELNAEIIRTNPSVLTPEQLRTLAEIEKLAHQVRDKMRTSLNGVPVYPGPVLLPPYSRQ